MLYVNYILLKLGENNNLSPVHTAQIIENTKGLSSLVHPFIYSIYSFNYSLNKCLLGTCSVPGIILGAWDQLKTNK